MRILNFFIFMLCIFSTEIASPQERILCICFDENTKYLETSINQDSGKTSFSITRPGYETKKQRKAAYAEYQKKPVNYPVFTIKYFSLTHYQESKSLDSIPCSVSMSVEEFRQHKGVYPKGVSAVNALFIKKENPTRFLIWEAMVMPTE